MDIDFDVLREIFLADAEDGLARMEASVLRLEEEPDDPEALAEVFRTVHTLKGDALTVGFPAPAELAHGIEDLLDTVRSGKARLTNVLATLLLQSVDTLRQLLESAQRGIEELAPDQKELLQRMSTEVGSTVLAPADSSSESVSGPAGPSTVEPRQEAARESEGGTQRRAETLRVGLPKLDQLLTLVGEIAVARGRLGQMLENSKAQRGLILEEHREAEQLYLDVQELVMKLRMVAVGPAFRRYARTVRDVSRAHGKQVGLIIEEGDAEVDNSILQLLHDPLAHMIRNAIDHGIEASEVRSARGKDVTGRLTLRAHHVAGSIIIELEDDGAGLDRDRIFARALELGKVGEGEVPADQDLFRLVFEPGFSTARKVSEISGRGVGMDVVRRNIEVLRGSVDISSERGKGTRVTMRLPLTLAIIDGLLIRIVDHTYLVPLDSVVESLDLPAKASAGSNGQGVANIRGRTVPFVRLREIFRANGQKPERENLVVVQLDDNEAGLVVDEVLGKAQTVIKPLAKIFRNLKGISGSAILSNGELALILDVPALLRREIARDKPTPAAAEGKLSSRAR